MRVMLSFIGKLLGGGSLWSAAQTGAMALALAGTVWQFGVASAARDRAAAAEATLVSVQTELEETRARGERAVEAAERAAESARDRAAGLTMKLQALRGKADGAVAPVLSEALRALK